MDGRSGTTFNWPLMWVTAGLVVIGLVNLYSAVYFWGEGGSLSLFWSQLVWTFIGFVAMFIVTYIDYHIFYRMAYPIYVIICVLLLLSIVVGQAVHGTHGWLALGPFRIQPAEFAKLAYIIVAAHFFANNPNPDGYSLWELWKPAALMLVMFSLIVLQGDMGSSIFIILIFVSMVLFAKVKWKTVVLCLIIASVGAVSVYKFGLKDYQRDRIFTFINPESDIRGSGYHLMQSKIAVGSGKLFGKGYLKGNINKLKYLPERHTDFIFSVFAEEWGFVGAIVLLGMYMAMLLMGIDVGAHAKDRFGAFSAIGIVSLLFWQLAVNLGGVLGLMPLTGVTLPFLSYGGSSMVAVMLAVGLLFSIHRKRFMF